MPTRSEINCSKKVRFECKKRAKRSARRRQSISGSTIRVYRCPHCDHWHLTSKRKRD